MTTEAEWGDEHFQLEENAESVANAALIAAAPEMLEALEAIISMVEATYATPDAMDDPIWKEARAALRKARGELGKEERL